MKMTQFLIICRVALFIVLLPSVLTAQKTVPADSLYRAASAIVDKTKEFEKVTAGKNVQSHSIPYDAAFRKKTMVTVTAMSNTVRKFTYVSYDESLTTSQRLTYYFDPAGKLVCHINRSGDAPFYEVYIGPYVVIFHKENDPANHIISAGIAPLVFAQVKYVVDYYLGASGATGYSTFDISQNHEFLLEVLKDLPLRQSPSPASPVVKTLPKGSNVYYLDRSTNTDSVSNVGRWVWYKVKVKSGPTGWVWGYPSGVKEKVDD